jgi:hypothetical protein
MRASVDDRTLTSLNGSSATTNARNAWIIGSMLAALAGILIAPTLTPSAPALTLLIVNAYAASVIGRLRSIPMTFVGAIILGLSIAYSVAYLPQNPSRARFRERRRSATARLRTASTRRATLNVKTSSMLRRLPDDKVLRPTMQRELATNAGAWSSTDQRAGVDLGGVGVNVLK